MHIDTTILYFLNGFSGHSVFIDTLIIFTAVYLSYFIAIAGIQWLYATEGSNRDKIYMLFVMAIATLIARGVITELIRFFYHRQRPFLEHPNLYLFFTEDTWSFPSGHATFFFALSSVMFLYNKKWGTGFLTASILVVLARVAAGVHYLSDIFFGMLIGMVTAYGVYFFVERYKKKRAK